MASIDTSRELHLAGLLHNIYEGTDDNAANSSLQMLVRLPLGLAIQEIWDASFKDSKAPAEVAGQTPEDGFWYIIGVANARLMARNHQWVTHHLPAGSTRTQDSLMDKLMTGCEDALRVATIALLNIKDEALREKASAELVAARNPESGLGQREWDKYAALRAARRPGIDKMREAVKEEDLPPPRIAVAEPVGDEDLIARLARENAAKRAAEMAKKAKAKEKETKPAARKARPRKAAPPGPPRR